MALFLIIFLVESVINESENSILPLLDNKRSPQFCFSSCELYFCQPKSQWLYAIGQQHYLS